MHLKQRQIKQSDGVLGKNALNHAKRLCSQENQNDLSEYSTHFFFFFTLTGLPATVLSTC